MQKTIKPQAANKKGAFVSSTSEIFPNFFVSSCHDAYDLKALQNNNISHILVCGENLKMPFKSKGNFTYEKLKIQDIKGTSLIQFFPQAFSFIESYLDAHNTYDNDSEKEEDHVGKPGMLVHCMAGCSRSVSLMTAYLMLKLNVSFDEMITYVKEKRPCARPNKGFAEQLLVFEDFVKNYNSKLGHSKYGGLTWKVSNFSTHTKTLLKTRIDMSTFNSHLSSDLSIFLKPPKNYLGVDLMTQYKNGIAIKQRELSQDSSKPPQGRKKSFG